MPKGSKKELICTAMLSACALFIGSQANAATRAVGCEAYAYSSSVDERAFNWLFYLNANADLNIYGISTPDVACSHWVNNGINEGRQAHAGFSSRQYLTRYSDIKNSLGATNYSGAVNHWITSGINENRVGYVDNGINNGWLRSTISNYDGSPNYKIFISTGTRTAGAVDSLMVNNTEYINSIDHGRQMQLALVATQHGQGWNPTEAGNCLDGKGDPTSSVHNSSNANGNLLSTSNTPAFWEYPGDTTSACVTGNGSYYTPAVNTTVTATSLKFNKSVQIGTQVGDTYMTNVIGFNSSIIVSAGIPGQTTTIAAPSINLAAYFRNAAIYNPTSNNISQQIYYGGSQSGTVAGSVSLAPSSYSDFSNLSCFTTFSQCQSNSLPIILSKGPLPNSSDAIATCTKSYSGPGTNYGNLFTTAMSGGNPQSLDPTTGLNSIFNIKANFTGTQTIPLRTYIVVAKTTPQANAFSQISLALNKLYSSGLCTLNTVTPF